tara:strand:+ start:1524 stop:1817 length:294 start_codon:yes stop_codon:yes gene_type:complete
MTGRIRITEVPPGSAPDEIRTAWVGVEIPLAPNQEVGEGKFWSGHENAGGHMVNTSDAIDALRAVGREDAADYWEMVRQMTGHQLRFGADCCEVVNV